MQEPIERSSTETKEEIKIIPAKPKTGAEIAKETIISYFGIDRVDVVSNKITIHFPEFFLVNLTRRNKHLIKDLYVYFNVSSNGAMGTIFGYRGTLSDKEYAGYYIHSHLHSRDQPTPDDNNFCLGDSDVSKLQATSQTGKFTKDDWILFCLSLEAYVQCESDNPYSFFRDIQIRRNDSTRNPENSEIVAIIKRFTLESLGYNIPLELTGTPRTPINAIIEDDFLRMLVPYIPERWLGMHDENKGYGVKLSREKIPLFFGETPYAYRWKGELKKIQVYSTFGGEQEKIVYDFPTEVFKVNLQRYINYKLNQPYETEYSNRKRTYSSADLRNPLFSNLLCP